MDTAEALQTSAITHGVRSASEIAKALAPSAPSRAPDRIGHALNAFREGVGALIPGTAETGNIAMGMNQEGTQTNVDERGKPMSDFPRAIGKEAAFVSNLLAPEAAGGLLKVAKAPAQSQAVRMVQNARKIQDPEAARFLLEQDAAGGGYSKLQKVADAANARTRTVSTAQPPVPSTVLGPTGQSLGNIAQPPVVSQVKDPTAWRGFYGLKKSLDRPAESALGREGTAAYLGHTIGGTPAEAAAVGATALTRVAPRAKAAQLLFNTVSRQHPNWTAAERAAALAQMLHAKLAAGGS